MTLDDSETLTKIPLYPDALFSLDHWGVELRPKLPKSVETDQEFKQVITRMLLKDIED